MLFVGLNHHSLISSHIFPISPHATRAILLRTLEDLTIKVGLWVQLMIRLRRIDLDVLMFAPDMPLQCRLRTVKLSTPCMRTTVSQHQILRVSSLTLHRNKLFSPFCLRYRLEQVQHHPLLGPSIRKPLLDPLLLLSESQVRSALMFLGGREEVG